MVLDDALKDARLLAAFIVERYGLDRDELLTFFSGSKGFHVGLPLSLCGTAPHPRPHSPAKKYRGEGRLSPSGDFNRVCRRLAEGLAGFSGVTIDTGVFDKVRLFRAPNSKHPKTGLRKRRLTSEELLGLKLDRIVQLAAEPLGFDLPDDPKPNEQAVLDWQEANENLRRSALRQRSNVANAQTRRARGG